jgi:hypothetical protein
MRLLALLVTAILTSVPALAWQDGSSSASSESSPSKDGAQPTLPVSLAKIREALAVAPAAPLKGLNEQPHFRVEVQEWQKFKAMLDTLKFETGGPPVPGGIYGYEQQQRLFPKADNPLAQPYAAFSQGELLQVMITTLMAKYFAGRIVNWVTTEQRARAEAEARKEVARAMDEFWAWRAQAPPQSATGKP